MILGLVIVHFHEQVVGTTGRGKTTTMNLFTGNKVSFLEKEGAPSESDLGSCWRRGPQCDQGKQDLSGVLQPPRKVAHINIEKLLQDLLHKDQAWPAWMDTVGLDEGDAEHVNGELVHRYLLFEARDIQEVLDSYLHSSQSEVLRCGNTC